MSSISSFPSNEKAGEPLRLGNLTIFKPHRLFWPFDYDGSTNPLVILAKSRTSQLEIANGIQRSVAFRQTLIDALALSTGPILAGWEYMSKQKPDRAISNCIVGFPQAPIDSIFLPSIRNKMEYLRMIDYRSHPVIQGFLSSPFLLSLLLSIVGCIDTYGLIRYL